MMSNNRLIAIYDFEFFPYALGDILTWNVRTAMRCEELNKQCVDIYVCVDKKYPASIYQRGLVNHNNFELFFNELYTALGTHPKLGNLYIFRQRDDLLEKLNEVISTDADNMEAIHDYLDILKHNQTPSFHTKAWSALEKKIRSTVGLRKLINRFVPQTIKETISNTLSHEDVLNKYFIKYIHSHERINQFAAQRGHIPFLQPALGCTPDIDELIANTLKEKKIVTFHLRLRQLDMGYGGDHTYSRDSDFLEWYDFLKMAGSKYPEIQFVALGRLQEKPLEILRLPNVTSLRVLGMGLGHELTLMLRSDLFIGTSSGFAALANFSAIPHFITKMNPGSCTAYAIDNGAERLPFARENQKLIYADETSTLLMNLLETGLQLENKATELKIAAADSHSQQINLNQWIKSHQNPANTARTTCRFYIDEQYNHEETAYLLLPFLEKARIAFTQHDYHSAQTILNRIQHNFSDLCDKFASYLLIQASIAIEIKDFISLQRCLTKLEHLHLTSDQEQTVEFFKKSLVSNFENEQHQKEFTHFMKELKDKIAQLNLIES